ncbi:MAG: SUMF1/EgtB/PvdO family nonheme iron enzyme [Planctomycetaceae bacterium]
MSLKLLTLTLSVMILGASTSFAEGRKLAVVVGVNAYRANSGLPALKHAAGDAVVLSGALRQQGFTVFEMTHEAAKEEGQEAMAPNIAYIRDQIRGILEFPSLGAGDSILITLHGHGVQFEQVDDAGNKAARFYFCPADATVEGIKLANEISERNHLLPLDELYDQLRDCKAATKLLIVDACRNDPTQPGVFRSGLASATLPKLPPPPGGTVAFFSCKPNQRAVEDPTLKQGVFTHFLVKGLSGQADQPLAGKTTGDGIITFAELSTYVANNTYSHVYEKYRVRQSPELRGEYDLNLPLGKVVPFPKGKSGGEVHEFAGDLRVKFCWCPPGTYLMGAPTSDFLRSDDEDQVRVTLSQGFWLSQMEVTQGLWESVMETRPWVTYGNSERYRVGAKYPANYITHGFDDNGILEQDSAIAFCRKLTARERLAGRLPHDWEFTLPTEAQWEYACRAGTTTSYNYGNNPDQLGDYAWYETNAEDAGETYGHFVGLKKPNRWNLYDMHGNMWEWCADWYTKALPGGLDPLVSTGRSGRANRGGSWNTPFAKSRSTYRGNDKSRRYFNIGMRVALVPIAQ